MIQNFRNYNNNKMKIKQIGIAVFAFLAIISCSEDDANKEINSVPKFIDQELTVKENHPSGQIIGELEASDVENAPLTYSIFKNDNNLFEVEPTGELVLAEGKSLDFETLESHQIIVTVSDGYRQTDAKVTIHVENVIDTKIEELSSFVTTWKTTEPNQSITIGTHPAYNYSYSIDWGDGTTEEQITTQNPIHEYEEAGSYTVIIQGGFPSIQMENSNLFSQNALVALDKWGTTKWQHLKKAFKGCSNLIYRAQDAPDLSSITSLDYMFAETKSFNADLNNWEMNNISSVSGMFANSENFNGEIDQWDVGKVVDMSYLFNNAKSFNGDLSEWNVENVENMEFMFNSATSFNANLEEWEVGNVTNMTAMFSNADNFNANISGWNVSNVESMFGMFTDAESFDQNLGGWSIKSIANLKAMLANSGMSRANYENTLLGWSQLADDLDALDGFTFGVNNLEYCSEEAVLARNNLMVNHGWEFIGDLEQCN